MMPLADVAQTPVAREHFVAARRSRARDGVLLTQSDGGCHGWPPMLDDRTPASRVAASKPPPNLLRHGDSGKRRARAVPISVASTHEPGAMPGSCRACVAISLL